PLQPALLHLAEHVAADRAVGSTVDAVVLLLLHGEVGPEDLLERVLLGGLAERVVGSVLHVRLVVLRLPGELLDLLMSLGQTLPTHFISSPVGGSGAIDAARRRLPFPRSASVRWCRCEARVAPA